MNITTNNPFSIKSLITIAKSENNKTIIKKTAKKYAKKEIPIKNLIENILLEHLKSKKEPLFQQMVKNFKHPNTINYPFKRICKHVGIKIINVKKKKMDKKVNLKSSSINTYMLEHIYITR